MDIPTDTGTPEGNQIVKDKVVFVSRRSWGMQYSLLFSARNIIDNKPLCSKLVYEPYPESGLVDAPPTIELSIFEVQNLIDELWKMGVRPSPNLESVKNENALSIHLDDMRKIAFKFLELK